MRIGELVSRGGDGNDRLPDPGREAKIVGGVAAVIVFLVVAALIFATTASGGLDRERLHPWEDDDGWAAFLGVDPVVPTGRP